MKKNHLIVNAICCFIFFSYLFFAPVIYAQSPTPNGLKTFRELMNVFLGPVNFVDLATPSPTSILQPLDSALGKPLSSNYVYFPQCDGNFDAVKLPNGCTLCQSGCGPTTVAMILSSYVTKNFAPDAVVNLYKQNGFYAGCSGTKINEAMEILLQNGLRTTDLMIYDNASGIDAVQDFKAYINSGWTIFALARFCSAGCSHYFWITDVDNNNNVWAYDPFYGRKQLPPYNENSRYPFPQYRMAFGVKK